MVFTTYFTSVLFKEKQAELDIFKTKEENDCNKEEVLQRRELPGKCGGGPPGPTGPGKRSPPGGPGKRPRPLPGGKPARSPPPGGPALPSPDICPDCVPMGKKRISQPTPFTQMVVNQRNNPVVKGTEPCSLFRDCISNWLSDCLLHGVTSGFWPCSSRFDNKSISFLDEASEPTQTRANLSSTENDKLCSQSHAVLKKI